MSEKDYELSKSTKPIGVSGTLISGGVYAEEYLNELIGVEGHEQYDKMRRSDPQIRKILAAIVNPIKSAHWFIDSASDETQDIEAAALVDKILFHDIEWNEKLNEILTFLAHGFSCFEVVHMNKIDPELGPYTTLAQLGFRKQSTLTKFYHDRMTGKLVEIEQQARGDVDKDVMLPAENLVIFYNEKEGDDNGFPLLRPLYGPYKRKLLTETLKMIGIERSAIPTPTLKFPSNIKPSDAEYAQAANVLANFVSAEDSYILYPEGWELNLEANGTFDPMKLEDSIKREDEKMAGAIVATFLELGTGGNGGAFALSDNLERFFLFVIESFAKVIADTINCRLIPNLIKLNYGDFKGTMPEMRFSGITNKAGESLMRIITGYSSASLITPDEKLEDYIRKAHNLPKKVEGEQIENEESQDEPNDDNQDNDSSDDATANSNNENEEANEDDTNENEDVQLSEIYKFAEAKTPRALIVKQAKTTSDVIREKMTFSAEKLVNDVMNKYKKLSEAQKVNAIAGIKVGGTAQFKRVMKGVLTTTAKESLDMVYKEVPSVGKIKLADNQELINVLLADDATLVKAAKQDFKNLPTHVKLLIEKQANRIVDSSLANIENRIAFQYMSDVQTINDENRIRQNLEDAVKEEIEAAKYDTAGRNTNAQIVNQTRNEYLFSKEVKAAVTAYRYTNSDPKSAICQKLSGRVFATNDAEFAAFSPPLHHNCKSYLTPVLSANPDIQPLPPITEAERKSITLSDYVNNVVKMIDDVLKEEKQ